MTERQDPCPCRRCHGNNPLDLRNTVVADVKRGRVWVIECQRCGESVATIVPHYVGISRMQALLQDAWNRAQREVTP